ncbi:MAG: hypothetical protein ACR2FV_06975 [Ornithinimicrobium sp.]|jgi:hypothetical protein|uniref:hypothetical protein n=1 Tax=Ornithinimicrobium sp. TaxID=1977084 RepID=UPI003D9BA54D
MTDSTSQSSARGRPPDVEQGMRAVQQAAERAAEAAERGEGEESDREIAALRHALALALDTLGVPPPRSDYP